MEICALRFEPIAGVIVISGVTAGQRQLAAAALANAPKGDCEMRERMALDYRR